uniref:Riboflavin transporter n=1 Tax=Pristionchus pacificus TaxID=54126 RepID=A0A8R1UT21_PRIPA
MKSPWLNHLLVLLFGMSAWLSIDSIYVQLPILSQSAPESWNLASYIVVIIQISCIFPFTYRIIRNWKREITEKIESPLIVSLLIIDIIGLLLTTFTYTSVHSVWLLLSIFILCIPCTMADVVFMPLIDSISIYRRLGSPSLVTTFYIGMGLGALLPSALSFAQGVNGSTRNFSYPVFIYIVSSLVVISLAAYCGIVIIEKRMENRRTLSQSTTVPREIHSSVKSIIFPITVSLVFISLFSPSLLQFQLLILSIVQLSIPSVLLPISSGFSAGFLSLLRTAAASRLAHSSHPKALFICGFVTQFGSFVGAITVFILANVFHLFISS